MPDLDRVPMPWNTAEAREELTRSPAWTAGLDFSTFPGDVPGAMLDWLPAAFSGSLRRGAVLHGPPGRGKTGLGVSALRSLARRGFGSTFQWNMVTNPAVRAAVESGEDDAALAPCRFESWSRLLALYRRERWDEEGWFEQLDNAGAALMLDDVGTDTGTPFRESFLLRHLEWAFERPRRAIILTINAPPSQWKALLGERATDRLLSERMFSLVPVAGEDSLR